ncbi:MAG: hypothetical protein JWP25_4651 [Bradyrhizobium sp.]|nr:hypothetical protein [Bradyrhizobium sp.]
MSDIVELLRDPGNDVTRDDAIAEILRLRGVLEELAIGFDRARDATPYMAEAQRLDRCAKFCRGSALPPSEVGGSGTP